MKSCCAIEIKTNFAEMIVTIINHVYRLKVNTPPRPDTLPQYTC